MLTSKTIGKKINGNSTDKVFEHNSTITDESQQLTDGNVNVNLDTENRVPSIEIPNISVPPAATVPSLSNNTSVGSGSTR